MSDIDSRNIRDNFDIAIVGMSGRFPGANNIDRFWKNLCDGVESITFFSDEDLKESGVPETALKNPNYVKAAPILEESEMFAASFFGYSPREAQFMDPQQRIFLECSWESLENAGYAPEKYDGLIGVFGGQGWNKYLLLSGLIDRLNFDELLVELGNANDYLATKVSYKLNLKGPSITLQTACSTSLVAVHVACQSLLNMECDMALAGGVMIQYPHRQGYLYKDGSILSPDGHCRAFDSMAKGTIFGSGCGVVVLKRFEDAVADGDFIYALIKGSAINNDGSSKVEYTAPSVDSQSAVIDEALENAGITHEKISYIETHGTGTVLGDPIEITALTNAFRYYTDKQRFCAIGSVKTNVGHLDIAAGITGLIKTALMLKNKKIPPSLHFKEANPNIDFENSPFYVNTKLSNWEKGLFPRCAGISSFGMGGTNVHVVLEEVSQPVCQETHKSPHMLTLSARTKTALDSMTTGLTEHLHQNPDLKIADVAYTLQVGRASFNHRRFVICRDLNDAVEKLKDPEILRANSSHSEIFDRNIAFMFSGQGSQFVNMCRELYVEEKIFREKIDYCSEYLKPHLKKDLREIIYPDENAVSEASNTINQTYITQPALFTIEYALAELLLHWGIRPMVLVGHSIGEYVAACLAGVFSIEDGLALIAARGSLIQKLPPGKMLAVHGAENEIQKFLNNKLSLAVVNGKTLCVVSGEEKDIEELKNTLKSENIGCRILHTSHAFHSHMMDPILDEFHSYLKEIKLNLPHIPFLSNVTGTWITTEQAIDPDYWIKHLRHTVRFYDCLSELFKDKNLILIEVGPGKTLQMLAQEHINKTKEHIVLSTTRHPTEKCSDTEYICNTIGKLWLSGVQIDWHKIHENYERYRVPLPTYRFERQKFSFNPNKKNSPNHAEKTECIQAADPVSFNKNLSENESCDIKSLSAEKIEHRIKKIWHDLLGIDCVAVDDNFFELGGTSLIAANFFSRIEKEFGKKLPLSTLFEAPTIRKLTGILCNDNWEAPWSPLVPIQPDGSKPPFFCMHPHRGNVLGYYELVDYLGPEQPFYALQARGLDGEPVEDRSLIEMAAEYLKEIRTIQSKGPYYLGGYCMGADIAFQMAQLLNSEGEEVKILVMIEPNHPDFPRVLSNTTFFHSCVYRVLEKIEFELNNIRVLKTKAKLPYIWRKIGLVVTHFQVAAERIIGSLLGKIHLRIPRSKDYKLFSLYEAHERAYENMQLLPYHGNVAIFRAKTQPYGIHLDPTLGWGPLMKGNLELYEIPGHYIDLFVEASVHAVAEPLKKYLQKFQNTSSLSAKHVDYATEKKIA